MVRTLVFNHKKKNITSYDRYMHLEQKPDTLEWTHLVSNEDKVIDIVMDDFGHDAAFEEDLLEDQRPRLSILNSNSAIVVIGAPVKAIMTVDDPDDGIIQISFIIKGNKLISVSDRNSVIISKIMDSYLKSKKYPYISATTIFSRIFEEIVENVIQVTELIEKKVDALQSKIIRGADLKGMVKEVEEIKDNLFYTQKILRADIEIVREILFQKKRVIRVSEFNEHIEDRLLYSLDIIDVARRSLEGLNSLYMAAISNKMNAHVYRLTMLGAIFLVPAIVASFWGMNVSLPGFNFWTIIGLSFVLSFLLFLWLRISRVKL